MPNEETFKLAANALVNDSDDVYPTIKSAVQQTMAEVARNGFGEPKVDHRNDEK